MRVERIEIAPQMFAQVAKPDVPFIGPPTKYHCASILLDCKKPHWYGCNPQSQPMPGVLETNDFLVRASFSYRDTYIRVACDKNGPTGWRGDWWLAGPDQ